MKEIILVGGGGHCLSIIDTLKNKKDFSIKGIIDLKENIGKKIAGVPIIGEDSQLSYFYDEGIKFAFVALGSIGDTSKRLKIYNILKKIGYTIPNIVDESAVISESAIISEGVFIGKGAIINTKVNIGKCSIINTGAIIDHESYIGDFVHVAPGATLSGKVVLENNVHLGTNSTVIQGIKIEENTLIGAGSVVVCDINKNKKAYGNPCKEVIK